MLLLRPDVEKLTAKHDVKGLIKALHYSRDRHVAAAAAESLGGLGDDRAAEPLITALDDDVDREPVIAALGRLGDPRAVDRLVRVVADGPAWLRDPAVAALVMIGAPAADFFVTTLQADDDALRTLAAHTLGTIGDDHAVGPLVAALRDHTASVRQAAAEALDRLGWAPDGGETGAAYRIAKRQWSRCATSAAIALLIDVLDDDDRLISQGAARTLAKIGARAVQPLIVSLDSTNVAKFVERPLVTSLGSTTAPVLVKIGTPAVEPLIATLNGDPSRAAVAAVILGRLGDARAVDPLVNALAGPDDTVRAAAVGALHWIGDTRVVDPLIALLDDDSRELRRAAAEALGHLGWDPTTSAARFAYWIALGDWDSFEGSAAVAPLIAALRNGHADAARALGRIGDRRAVEPLVAVLGDSSRDPYDRATAAGALGRIADPRALGPLLAAFNDHSYDLKVRRAIAEALVALYHSGQLSEDQKSMVLTERDTIIDRDPHADEEWDWYGSRPLEQGIAVDFPL